MSAASRWLRWWLLVTAVTVVGMEVLILTTAAEPGLALIVRTGWALLRALGFLLLMRMVRRGRAVARPFGLILCVTTVFAVARLAQPTSGGLDLAVMVGFGLLSGLCGVVVGVLYTSPGLDRDLSARPVRRHVPGWVLTVRVAVLAYVALLLVPWLVALGSLDGADAGADVVLLVVWFALTMGVFLVVPLASFFVLRGSGWARWLIGVISVLVLIAQPLLCYALLGRDGLLRDGLPMMITALVALYALHRSRGLATWVRPKTGTPPVPADASPSS